MALTDTQFNTLTSILGGNKTDRVNGVSVTPGVPSVNTTINAGDLTKAIPKTFPTITTTQNRQVTLPPPTGVTLDANGVAIPSQAKTGDNSNLLQFIYDQIGGGIDTLNTKGTAETQLQNELKLSQKREAATASYNKYNQAKVQLQQQLDQMRSAEANKVGGVGGGYSATIQDFERKGNANLANLAILAQIDQGNYNDAQQTIKEKLDAQFQPVQDNIDNLYKFAQLYGNDPEIQAAIQQKKTDLANVTKTADELHTLLLQNGAPQSVYTALDKVNNDYVAGKITAAEAQSKMYQAAGNYGVDKYKPAQTDSLNSKTSGGTPGFVSGGLSPEAQAVADNPNLLNNFTATVKGKIITELSKAGYDTSELGGKPLSDGAISLITQDKTAISQLENLKNTIKDKEQYLGPISGFQRLNPYSPAKILQAQVDLVRQNVGKALEGGVLRKEDEDKYKQILTTLNDTPNLSVKKIDNLISTITSKLDEYTSLQTSAGRSSNVTKPLNKKGDVLNGSTSTGNTYTITKE